MAGLVVTLIAMVIGANAGKAEAGVYWGGDTLGRANVDGSEALWPLPDGWFPVPFVTAYGLDSTDQHLYWASPEFRLNDQIVPGSIGRSSLDGRDLTQQLIKGVGSPVGVAVEGSYLYWSDPKGNRIGRALLDGSAVEPAFISGATSPCGVAADSTHLYWANQEVGSIGRATLDGSVVEQDFIEGLRTPCGIEVGGGYVFWGDQGLETLGRAGIDGTAVNPSLVTGAGEPWDLAVSSSHVFWADRHGNEHGPKGALGRASLDGTEVNYELVPDLNHLTAVAVDAHTYSKPSLGPRPSDYLRFGKVTHDRRRGTVQVIIEVPARGDFRVDSPAIGWSIDKGSPPPRLGGTFRWKLRLWPGKGQVGKRINRKLRRTGRAPISLRVTYQQEGRLPLKGSRALAVQQRVKRPKPRKTKRQAKHKPKPPVSQR